MFGQIFKEESNMLFIFQQQILVKNQWLNKKSDLRSDVIILLKF